MVCERCGNEFSWGYQIEKEDGVYIRCPYCRQDNKRVYKKYKKKGRGHERNN